VFIISESIRRTGIRDPVRVPDILHPSAFLKDVVIPSTLFRKSAPEFLNFLGIPEIDSRELFPPAYVTSGNLPSVSSILYIPYKLLTLTSHLNEDYTVFLIICLNLSIKTAALFCNQSWIQLQELQDNPSFPYPSLFIHACGAIFFESYTYVTLNYCTYSFVF
jgi:hypothetical protein